MRREFACVLIAFLTSVLATSQQPDTPIPRPAIAQPANVTVYYAGPGVTSPVLFPPTISISVPRSCIELDGVVKLSVLVDENGVPRDVQALQSDDARLSDFAVAFIAEQRFNPGRYNNSPAAVAIALTAALHTCALPMKKKFTQEGARLTLRSHPFIDVAVLAPPSALPIPPPPRAVPAQANAAVPSPDSSPEPYKAGSRISPPEVLSSVDAEFSDEARRAAYQGVCLISLVVDAEGNPQNIRVVRALGMGLDEKAIEAIRQYKFKPAMKDGTIPVPVAMTIEVAFRLYHGKKPDGPPPNAIDAPRFDTVPDNVVPPALVEYVKPKYSSYGRQNRISGVCVIGLTVDIEGIPQNVRVVTSLEPSLDENAIEAVKRWRYAPAMINGIPAQFESTVKVNFTLPE
jgi:TonB family protein